MKKFVENRVAFAAILFLFALALAWNLAHGSAVMSVKHAGPTSQAELIAHGPIMPPTCDGCVRVAHGPIMPPTCDGCVRVAHGPIMPPTCDGCVRIQA